MVPKCDHTDYCICGATGCQSDCKTDDEGNHFKLILDTSDNARTPVEKVQIPSNRHERRRNLALKRKYHARS